jgi:hypothetical protein
VNLTDLLKDQPENPSTLTIPSWVKDKGGGGASDDEEGGDIAPTTKNETLGLPPLEPMPPVCVPTSRLTRPLSYTEAHFQQIKVEWFW